MFKRILSINLLFCFLFSTLFIIPVQAIVTARQRGSQLPIPGTMINLSPAYEPVIIKGITVHKNNPFFFDFIVDIGQDKLSGEPLKKEGEKLIKYFLASLAIPEKDLWVNLSPYEKDKIIPEALGRTDMGRDLLAQDYILKQLTASLIYPERDLGKQFWDKVYAKAQQIYGTTEVSVNTFNKVWIVADRAEIFERNQTAFVVDQHLKVMLEEDYLALNKNNLSFPNVSVADPEKSSSISSQIIRDIILPEIEKEVNTGNNFANLRQIFNSIILASWYKKNLKQALLNQVYADRSKIKGIDLNDPTMKEQIYQQYLKAYKKGVFNYISTEGGSAIGGKEERQSRKYFSGGVLVTGAAANPLTTTDTAKLSRALPDRALVSLRTDFAMNAPRGMTANSRGESDDAAMVTYKTINGHNYPILDVYIALRNIIKTVYFKAYKRTPVRNGPAYLAAYDKLGFRDTDNEIYKDIFAEFNPKLTLTEFSVFDPEYQRNILYGGIEIPVKKGKRNFVEVLLVFFNEMRKGLSPLAAEIDEDSIKKLSLTEGKKVNEDDFWYLTRMSLRGMYRVFSMKSNQQEFELNFQPISFEKVEEGGERLLTYFQKDSTRLIKKPIEFRDVEGKRILGQLPKIKAVHYLTFDDHSILLVIIPDAAMKVADVSSATNVVPGGIDLNTSNGMKWKVRQDDKGIEMDIDSAMLARIQREGVEGLYPVILSITPVVSIWPLVGVQAPI